MGKPMTKAKIVAALAESTDVSKKISAAYLEALASMALNYVLAMPRVACVIPGFRNERQARINIGAAGRSLTADDIKIVQDALT